MTRLARFRDLIGAYGADPRRWPPDERAEAEALLARSPEAAALQRTAAALDALLDRAPAPAAPRLGLGALIGRPAPGIGAIGVDQVTKTSQPGHPASPPSARSPKASRNARRARTRRDSSAPMLISSVAAASILPRPSK